MVGVVCVCVCVCVCVVQRMSALAARSAYVPPFLAYQRFRGNSLSQAMSPGQWRRLQQNSCCS